MAISWYLLHGLSLQGSNIPYFVFTHGMLDPWFQKYYFLKHLKKTLYWRLIENKILFGAKAVIFLSNNEKKLAFKSFKPFYVKPEVISHGVEKKNFKTLFLKGIFDKLLKKNKNKKIVLFLSRIHEKKGCDILIKSFARVFGNNNKYLLTIAGNDKSEYALKLKSLCIKLNLKNVFWTGFVNDYQKWSLFKFSDISCFPSHSENFGTSIVESLSMGTPVIISNKVNIYEKIKLNKAGLVGSDSINDTTKNLLIWSKLSDKEKKKLKKNSILCFKKNFDLELVGKNFRNLFDKHLKN